MSYSDTENRLRELQNSFVQNAEIDMGYYSYTAKGGGYVPVEVNCFVELCSLSDLNQTCLDVVMDKSSYIAKHKHKNNDEYVFVIHGEVTEIESRKILTTGQSLSIPKNKYHGFESKDGCKMKVIFKPKMK